MSAKHVIAVDLGAETGRVMQVSFDGLSLQLNEVQRFPSYSVTVHDSLYWDVLHLWREISAGIRAVPAGAAGIGVDSWGVDFAFLGRDGKLLSNPLHYRDRSWEGMMEWVFERMPRREVFERTGLQFIAVNAIWRLAALVKDNSPLLDVAHTYLTLPDLFNYWLTGSKTCEFTHVTTHQIYNPRQSNWDFQLLKALGLPTEMFGPIVQPGTRIGEYEGIPVFTPGCHDTASAVVAVPTTSKDYAFLSSGTWSLLGLEVDEPVITDESYEANVTNEGGVYGTFRFLKNIAGLWLVQQSRTTWREQGREYDYAQIAAMAEEAAPFRSLIDPDDVSFYPPGDMPSRIRDFCKQNGQPEPQGVGEVARTIYESLALKYRYVLDQLTTTAGKKVDRLHVIGGGSRNALLCQMAANAIGRPVVAGPAEATALGNAIVQFVSLGEFKDVAEARALLSQSAGTITYEPRNTADWDVAYERFLTILTEK